MEFNVIAGGLLFFVGLAGFLKPEQSIRFWFLGMLDKNALTDGGQKFFRALGVLCMAVGGLVAVGF